MLKERLARGTLRPGPFSCPHLPSLPSVPILLPLCGRQELLQGHKTVLVGVHLGSQIEVSGCAGPAARCPPPARLLTFFITCSRMRSRSSSISLMSSSSFFGSYTFSSCGGKGGARGSEHHHSWGTFPTSQRTSGALLLIACLYGLLGVVVFSCTFTDRKPELGYQRLKHVSPRKLPLRSPPW